tara:strand:+ start:228 stop:422 length:195 start_codon:yes stop_codon:yes gene_type:complete
MKVGDLVKIISDESPFGYRPCSGSLGVIVEIKFLNFLGEHYYVYINDVGWRFYKNELELLNGDR